MMEIDSGYQVSDATPLDDGSYSTQLVDSSGAVVATVTRLPDGTVQGTPSSAETDLGGSGWQNLLGKVTTFLDGVAQAAKSTSDQATRVSRAIKGGAAGAQAGYNAPIDWKPWAVVGVVLIAGIGVALASSSSRRR